MLPASPEIIQCYHCKGLLISHRIASGNTFGAFVYSDGKQEAHMLPPSHELTRCGHCKAFLWLDSAEVVDTPEWDDLAISGESKYADLPEVDFPSLNEYLEALGQQVYRNTKEERYIRIELWWAYNDRIRRSEPLYQTKEDEIYYKENLLVLQRLLSIRNGEQLLMKAETFRNLSEFSSCQELLTKLSKPDLLWIKEKLLKACEEGKAEVFILN